MRRVAAAFGAAALLLAWLPGTAQSQSACTIEGTPGNDFLTGTPGADVICGLAGDDRLVGAGGADTLLGGDGSDVLEGGDGEDALEGGPGPDLLYGGAADDELTGDEGTDYLDGGDGGGTLDGGLDQDTCVLRPDTQLLSCTRSSPRDPNDATGLADVSRIYVGFAGSSATWIYETFASFTIAQIRDHAYFVTYLDTEGDEFPEYYALLRSNGTNMVAALYRNNPRGTFITSLTASKPTANSVKVHVPWSRMNPAADRTFIRWYGVSLYVSDACPDTCIDKIPAESALVRPLP